jgi:hypothetical protein
MHSWAISGCKAMAHQGLKSKQNQREGNTPPLPIAILLVLRNPKISFKLIAQPMFFQFSILLHF